MDVLDTVVDALIPNTEPYNPGPPKPPLTSSRSPLISTDSKLQICAPTHNLTPPDADYEVPPKSPDVISNIERIHTPGKTKYAHKVFDEITNTDIVAYTSIINAYAHSGDSSAYGAFKIASIMQPQGLLLNHVMLAAKSAVLQEGRVIHGYAVRRGMQPGDILTASNGNTIEVNNTNAIGSGLDQSYPWQSKYGHSDGNYTEIEKGDKKIFDDNASKAELSSHVPKTLMPFDRNVGNYASHKTASPRVMDTESSNGTIVKQYFGDSNSHYSVENSVHDDIDFAIPPKPPDQIITGFLCCGESEFQRTMEDGNDKQ
ncbi:hypothetical protein RYX36_020158 [Vicia faba]